MIHYKREGYPMHQGINFVFEKWKDEKRGLCWYAGVYILIGQWVYRLRYRNYAGWISTKKFVPYYT